MDFKTDLTIANRKHDIVAIQVFDKREAELPSVGLMYVHDAETDKERLIDTSSNTVRETYKRWWNDLQDKLSDTFKKSKVDSISISTDQDYVRELMNLFNLRS